MDLKFIKIPNENVLELMIKEEEKIRMSVDYQNLCTQVKDIPNGWLNITEKMQLELVKKYGFDDPISNDIACNMLRRARYIFPNNKIFTQVPVYVRCNKANKGNFIEGDIVPNILIHKKCGENIQLQNLLNLEKPTLIIGSSHT